jgi:hypothetical protein
VPVRKRKLVTPGKACLSIVLRIATNMEDAYNIIK